MSIAKRCFRAASFLAVAFCLAITFPVAVQATATTSEVIKPYIVTLKQGTTQSAFEASQLILSALPNPTLKAVHFIDIGKFHAFALTGEVADSLSSLMDSTLIAYIEPQRDLHIADGEVVTGMPGWNGGPDNNTYKGKDPDNCKGGTGKTARVRKFTLPVRLPSPTTSRRVGRVLEGGERKVGAVSW